MVPQKPVSNIEIKITIVSDIFFFNFLFYIGAQVINNSLLFSGVQQSHAVRQVHVSIHFQTLSPFRLLLITEQSSLSYTISPCWLSIFNIAV